MAFNRIASSVYLVDILQTTVLVKIVHWALTQPPQEQQNVKHATVDQK